MKTSGKPQFLDREFLLLVGITVVVVVYMYVTLGQRLFTADGLQSMSLQVSEFGFLALAMGIAMLTGGIDLSIVSAAALAGVMSATVMSGKIIPITPENSSVMLIVGILVALVTGLLCGLLNGFLIAKVSVPPILATLATMILFSGIGMAITNGQSVPVAVKDFANITTLSFGSVPAIAVVLVLVFFGMAFVLNRTRLGRKIFLFGENEVALRFSGAKSERVIIMSYAVIGLLVGITAIVMTSRANSMRVGFGDAYLLQAILVVVLAGFNPFGGKGRILSLGVALVMLQVLSTAFTALKFTPYAKNFAWGGILLLVMVLNHYVAKWGSRSSKAQRAALNTATGHMATLRAQKKKTSKSAT